MLLQGLRSCEVLALDQEDLILSEAQIRVRGKGNKVRLLPLPKRSSYSIITCVWNVRLTAARPCLFA